MFISQRPLKILVLLFLLAGASFFGFWEIRYNSLGNVQKIRAVVAPQASPSPQVAPADPQPQIYYPIAEYASRLKVRSYDKQVKPGDEKSFVCGAPFNGLHDGDDLEITPDETDTSVPVFSIATGTVIQVSSVEGYGGLLVAKYKINNEDLTAYYGHLKLSAISLKPGDSLSGGEQIGILGKGCSSEISGERKHLHFAIHRGSSVDIRGYVQTEQELTNWLNPLEFLKTNGAVAKE